MAATGLLNSNPYGKAVALDFSTKATNTAIQLIQKEQAKKESLDRYFKDYEKSINSAGMRDIDQNVFLQKMNDAKLFYLQNQDRILMPSKYGAQYQSEYMGKLKDAQVTINQSKQEAANTKTDADHYYQAIVQGLDVPDGYMDARRRADLPLGNPEHQTIDPFAWNFTKPFNQDEFFKDITAGLKPDVTKSIGQPDGKGNIQTAELYEYSPDQLETLINRSEMLYGVKAGVTNQTNKIIKSGEFLNYKEQFNKLYPGQDINTAKPKQITAAIGLSLTPHARWENGIKEDKMFWTKLEQENRIAAAKAGKSNIVVNTGGGETGTNPPAASSVIEAVVKLNKNYALPTSDANLFDITNSLGGYSTIKFGSLLVKPKQILYNKSANKFILKYNPDDGIDDQSLSPDNYKITITNLNRGAQSQKFNGPIKQ